jgi:dolichol-phosphate mannosyltransferase
MNKGLVIIPTYNEKENVRGIAPAVLAASPLVDVLIVDDNSPDGTGDIVAEMMKSEPRLHLMRRAGKLGLGTAYIAGFKWGLERGYEGFILFLGEWTVDVIAFILIAGAVA